MRLLAAAGVALALATAPAAFAQTAPAASTPSVEKTAISDLIADPATKAVLQKDMPALLAYEGLDMIKGMTLREISVYPQAQLDDAKLAAIQKDLDAAKATKP